MGTWTNADGLKVLVHETQGEVNDTGSTFHSGRRQFIYNINDATELGDTDTAAVGATDAYIPSGAVIINAFFVVDTAFTSGGSAVLDLGLKQADGTNTDDDGIDAAMAVASLTANSVTTSNGALIGTRTATNVYPMATYDTAAFTAGAGRLVIEYFIV